MGKPLYGCNRERDTRCKSGHPFFVFSLFREKTGLIYAPKRDRISLS